MTRYATAASTLTAAVGLALGLQLAPASAQEMKKGMGKEESSQAMKDDSPAASCSRPDRWQRRGHPSTARSPRRRGSACASPTIAK